MRKRRFVGWVSDFSRFIARLTASLTINLIFDLFSALKYRGFVPARLQAATAVSRRQVRVLGRKYN